MTPAEKARRHRDKMRGGPPRQLRPCGTVSAYKRHLRRGEPLDEACRAAWSEWQRDYYRSRRGTLTP